MNMELDMAMDMDVIPPQGMPAGMTSGMPSGVPNGMHSGMPNNAQSGMSNGVPNGVPNGMPNGMQSDAPNSGIPGISGISGMPGMPRMPGMPGIDGMEPMESMDRMGPMGPMEHMEPMEPMEPMEAPPAPMYNLQPPIGIPVSTPASMPQAYPPQQLLQKPTPSQPASKGPDLLFRVQMGFESRVQSEVYWSLSTLLSFSTARNFDLLKSRLDLVKLVIEFVCREWDAVTRARTPIDDDHETIVRRQKVLEALLIVRNMCLDAQIAKELSVPCEPLVLNSIRLPLLSQYSEMRLLCLEICEHVCFYFPNQNADTPLFKAAVALLDSNDKSVLVAAVRTVARLSLCDSRDTSPLLNYPTEMARLAKMLLIDDSELISAVLDLFVQLTSRLQRVEQLQILGDPNHLCMHLLRLCTFKMDFQSADYIRLPRRTKRPAPLFPPEISPAILHELLAMNEPERATMWIRSSYDADPEGEVLQVSLWSNYQKLFEPHERDGTGKRMLKAIDFIRTCTNNVRGAHAKVLSPPEGPKKFIIKGLVPREKAVAPSQLLLDSAQKLHSDGNGRPPPAYTDVALKVLKNIAGLQGGEQLVKPFVRECVLASVVNPTALDGVCGVLNAL
ncbi:Rsc9 protein [Starmerella bacillaris]|uniref:Rsc9 protein n=1 Tax=Starmerella bacillaris TaxID=1247836 RepID=A0AAV5RMY4_STABA|nr:Rsc9 protein [Starmerella bacillaris]